MQNARKTRNTYIMVSCIHVHGTGHARTDRIYTTQTLQKREKNDNIQMVLKC